MAVNIGPRIGIEGEAEYRKQINNITQAQKTLNAEMKQSESAFDKSTSAQQKNAAKAKNLTKQVENQEKKVAQLRKMTKESADKFGENSTQTLKWKEALANAETELNRLNKELAELDKSTFSEKLQNAGQGLQNIGSKVSSVGDTLTKNVTVPLAAIGAASVAAYNEVDDAMDIIVKKTGATGDELEAMQKSARKIAKTIPTSFEKSAKAVGEVNTRFGITGDALEDLSTYFLEFAELNDTDVSDSVDKVQKSMKAFGVETKDAKKVLDVMNATGQRTGVSMSSLSDSMVKNSASLQEMGLDAYSAIEFLGDLEVSGADVSTVMMGLKTALKNAAAEGKSLPEKLSEFDAFMSSSASDADKLNYAIETFGSKAGSAIYEACKKGGLGFQSLDSDATKYFGNVEKTYEGVLGPESKLVTTMNSLKDTGSQIGETLLTILEPAVSSVGDYINKLGDWWDSLDAETQEKASSVALKIGASGPIVKAMGELIENAGKVTSAVGKIAGSKGLGAIAAYAGPIGLVAGSVAAVAWAMKTSHWKLPNYDQLMSDAKALEEEIERIQTDINNIGQNIDVAVKGIDVNTQPVEYLQKELHKCFDENGALKTGMEETASFVMGQLNTAMGTDLSTTFTTNMEANKSKLAEVDQAIDSYINKMKEAAITQTFTSEYGNALIAEKEAATAAGEAYDALLDTYTRMSEVEAQLAQDKIDYANGVEIDTEANANLRRELASLTEVFDEQTQNYVEAAGAAAEASGEVKGLETAMDMLGSADPAERSKAPEFFASITTNAKQAGKTVRKEADSAFKEVSKKASKIADDPWKVEIEVENPDKQMKAIKKQSEKIISNMTGRVVDIAGASPVAQAAKKVMVSTLTGLTGSVGGVIGAVTAATSARSSMQSIFNSPLSAKVSSVSGWLQAVQNAWSNMQSWFNSNPLTQTVRTVTSKVSSGLNIWGWANGGIVDEPTYGVFGEAGPEAFIPLSSGKRGRALQLYHEVGQILGVGSGGGTVNHTSTTNMGGININVYTTPNQNANEIADIVSRKISAQVYSKGAVFG